MERGNILGMSRRRRLYLVLLSLPIWVGLLFSLLANWLLQPNSSFLYPAEVGIAAFVIGGVIREPRIFGFLIGFLITFFLLLLYFWDQRSARQTQILLTEAQREAERSRRSFLRRLGRETTVSDAAESPSRLDGDDRGREVGFTADRPTAARPPMRP